MMGFQRENSTLSTYIAALENDDQHNFDDVTVTYLVVFSSL